MSIRALWIIAVNKEELVFYRKFASVEARCHSLHGDLYIPFQQNEDIVSNLLTEVGIKEKETFLINRNTCQKPVLSPVYEVPTSAGKLWPVVVVERQGLLFCALSLLDCPVKEEVYPPLLSLNCVSVALDVLLAVAKCVASVQGELTPGSLSEQELNKFLSASMPFGRLFCADVGAVKSLWDPRVNHNKSKSKPPLWKPIPYKGKPQISVQVKENVRVAQYNKPDCVDVIEVFGTVTCTVEVEDSLSEISLAISSLSVQDIVTSPHAISVENEKTGTGSCSVRLRFHSPPSSFVLCHYKVPSAEELPISGSFKARCGDRSATLLLQLQLNHRVKNSFQSLRVHIPFHHRACLQRLEGDCTVGTASLSQDNSALMWILGSKFPSKNLEVSMNAKVYFKPRVKAEENSGDSFCKGNNLYAQVIFVIQDYTQSGCSVDDKTIRATKVTKLKCTISHEYISKQYKIWNSYGDVPAVY